MHRRPHSLCSSIEFDLIIARTDSKPFDFTTSNRLLDLYHFSKSHVRSVFSGFFVVVSVSASRTFEFMLLYALRKQYKHIHITHWTTLSNDAKQIDRLARLCHICGVPLPCVPCKVNVQANEWTLSITYTFSRSRNTHRMWIYVAYAREMNPAISPLAGQWVLRLLRIRLLQFMLYALWSNDETQIYTRTNFDILQLKGMTHSVSRATISFTLIHRTSTHKHTHTRCWCYCGFYWNLS